MATHSSVLAWRFLGMAEPGKLLSMGLQSRTQLKRLSSSSRDLKRLGKGKPFPGEFSGEAGLDLQGKRYNQLPAVSWL